MARVLLVDDDDLVRKVVRVVLEAEGHEVTEAAHGEEALARVGTAAPDAVVLDLMMPGTDGLDVCRRIKSDHPSARVLVLSSRSVEESQDSALEAGADAVMGKPFSALELLSRLSELMEEA